MHISSFHVDIQDPIVSNTWNAFIHIEQDPGFMSYIMLIDNTFIRNGKNFNDKPWLQLSNIAGCIEGNSFVNYALKLINSNITSCVYPGLINCLSKGLDPWRNCGGIKQQYNNLNTNFIVTYSNIDEVLTLIDNSNIVLYHAIFDILYIKNQSKRNLFVVSHITNGNFFIVNTIINSKNADFAIINTSQCILNHTDIFNKTIYNGSNNIKNDSIIISQLQIICNINNYETLNNVKNGTINNSTFLLYPLHSNEIKTIVLFIFFF